MEQLENAERVAKSEIINKHFKNGVRFIDKHNVYIDKSVQIDAGATIMPNVLYVANYSKKGALIEVGSIIENSIIHEDVNILPYTLITESEVRQEASVGPFPRVRPKTVIGEKCKIGNFVETKKSILHEIKVSHLSYVGDAEIGKSSIRLWLYHL